MAGLVGDVREEVGLLAGREALLPLPPQLGQLLLRLVGSVPELHVVGDGVGSPVVGVAEEVGQVGADGRVQLGVGVPGVLAAFVCVEQAVQTGSPVILRLLLTPPVRPVQVSHHLLLNSQYVGLVSLQVEEVYPEHTGHVVLLYEEGELSWRVEEHLDILQQRLVRRISSNRKPQGVTITGSGDSLRTERLF